MEGSRAVVRVEVRYGEPTRREYRDLWVLRFAEDGRVDLDLGELVALAPQVVARPAAGSS